jgi:hypothetical protein
MPPRKLPRQDKEAQSALRMSGKQERVPRQLSMVRASQQLHILLLLLLLVTTLYSTTAHARKPPPSWPQSKASAAPDLAPPPPSFQLTGSQTTSDKYAPLYSL